MGDRISNLAKAVEIISSEMGSVVKQSSVYETAAWGKENQQAFLNMAIEVDTNFSALQLMQKIISSEEMMGRRRNEKWEPRIIDIDILFFNDDIINDTGAQNFWAQNVAPLQVPHPLLHQRRFSLVPLDEIIPDYIHPVLKKSIHQLLIETKDSLAVKKISATLAK
jgi:2-amino-4-hydroxy-6-hydroxymethyldihydropteridine diphosphokinase